MIAYLSHRFNSVFQSRRTLLLLTCVLAICLCGCDEDDYAEVPVQPVTGKLLVKDRPAYGAYIVFHPSDSVGLTKGNKPFARASEDGSFTVTTYTSGDGVPQGDFKVTVIWPGNPEARGPSPDRLKGRYATPERSGLDVRINADTKELPTWDLE